VLALPALAVALGWFQADGVRDIVLSTIALVFTAITALVLVGDLTRKDRFLRILLHPQNKSWLARGTYVLMLYSVLAGLFWFSAVSHYGRVSAILIWPTVFAGFFAAIYTAFLFGQCEGRDLWQTPLLPVHLIVQTLLCGSAVLTLLAPLFATQSPRTLSVAVGSLAAFLGLHVLTMLGEISMPHITDNAAYAVRLITHGPFRKLFWGVAVGLGGLLPLLLFWLSSSYIAAALAGVLSQVGLFAFEWCFIMAGQSVPNS